MAGSEAKVGTALIDYAAKDSGFSKTTKKVNNQLTGFEKKADKARGAAGRLNAAIGKLSVAHTALAAAAIGAIKNISVTAFVDEWSTVAVEMGRVARTAGLTSEQLQVMRKAMGEFNIDTKVTEKALVKFVDSMSKARQGSKLSVDAFSDLGISMEDLETLSTYELLLKVGDGMKSVNDVTKRSGAAIAIFGAKLSGIADVLGRKDFRDAEYIQSIKDTGIATDEAISQLESYVARVDTIGDKFETKYIEIAAKAQEAAIQWKETTADLKLAVIDSGLNDAVRWLVDQLGAALNGWKNLFAEARNFFNFINDRTQRDQSIADNIGVPQKVISDYRKALDKEIELENRLAKTPSWRAQLVRNELEDARIETQRLFLLIKEAEDAAKEASKEVPGDISGGDVPGYGVTVKIIPQFDDSVVREEARFLEQTLSEVRIRNADKALREAVAPFYSRMRTDARDALNSPEYIRRIIDAENREAASQARLNRQMAEMANAPLNEFGGVGPNVITDEQIEKQKRYTAEVKRAEAAWFDLSVQTRDQLAPVFDGLNNQLNTFFSSIIDGTASASDAFKNLAAQIAQAVFQALVLQPLIDSVTGGLGSFFGLPVTARASGGPVSARSPYLVGEKGPELFVPNNSGTIVSNKDMMNAPVINQHNEFKLFDDTGFEQRMIPISAAIEERTRAAVFDDLRRPGARTL